MRAGTCTDWLDSCSIKDVVLTKRLIGMVALPRIGPSASRKARLPSVQTNGCRCMAREEQKRAKRGSMLLTPERLAYCGLFGAPSCRVFGATAIYLAVDSAFELSIDGGPRRMGWIAAVPPNTPHQLFSADRTIRDLLIEAESLRDGSPLPLSPGTVEDRSAAYGALSAAFDAWLGGDSPADASCEAFDRFFLGGALEPRCLDGRIARIVQLLQADPFAHVTTSDCARMVNLSVPRFVHLFREQLDTTLRAHSVWKRARAVLPSMTGPCSLTQLALDAGYADSTHFSHSIRRVFGLRPRDILTGSQRLALRRPAA